DEGLRRVGARDQAHGIARHHVHDGEGEEGHAEEHRHRLQQAPEDVACHAASSSFTAFLPAHKRPLTRPQGAGGKLAAWSRGFGSVSFPRRAAFVGRRFVYTRHGASFRPRIARPPGTACTRRRHWTYWRSWPGRVGSDSPWLRLPTSSRSDVPAPRPASTCGSFSSRRQPTWPPR